MNTKLIVALVIVAVLAVTVVGLVAAQIATSTPSPNGTTANGAHTGGFLGWMGRCLGFRGDDNNFNSPCANPTTTDQGSNGYGRCGMIRSFP